jgi:hypothetical protein
VKRAILVALVLAAVGCGGTEGDGSTPADGDCYPITVSTPGHDMRQAQMCCWDATVGGFTPTALCRWFVPPS